jgi:hypothetical protein
LELARLADLPSDVMAEGRRVATALAALHARHQEESESSKIATRRKALLRVTHFFYRPLLHSLLLTLCSQLFRFHAALVPRSDFYGIASHSPILCGSYGRN